MSIRLALAGSGGDVAGYLPLHSHLVPFSISDERFVGGVQLELLG